MHNHIILNYLVCHHWQSNLVLADDAFVHFVTLVVHKLGKILFPIVFLMLCLPEWHHNLYTIMVTTVTEDIIASLPGYCCSCEMYLRME